ncbi:hypothetical protein PINS_up014113 [Pythium insidiosum]|nr:hypothetical protein PINS_up014113 [Pythium insidiosum]
MDPVAASEEDEKAAENQEEDVALRHYLFLPEHLRHHLRYEADERDGDDDKAARDAVRHARRTRSAALVASLLYPETPSPSPPPQENDKLTQHTSTQRSGRSPPRRRSPRKHNAKRDAAAVPASSSPPVSRLYSAEIEQELTKRMTLDRAIDQLDVYVRDLQLSVDRLDASDGDAWIWDVSGRLTTSAQGSVPIPTLLQVQRRVLQTVASCLPDCDVYLAAYDALPLADVDHTSPTPCLRFVAASPLSEMLHRVLPRDGARSVALETLDSLEPTLLPDIASVPSLRRVDPRAPRTGPFACLALVDESDTRALGVLCVDACRRAQSLRPENMTPRAVVELLQRRRLSDAATELARLRFGGRQLLAITELDLQHRAAYRHLKIATKKRLLELITALRRGVPLHLVRPPRYFADDEDALAFLDDVVARAGRLLDWFARRVHWHRVLAQRTVDATATALDLYAALVLAVARALVGVERVSVWKISDGATAIDAIASTQLPDERLLPFLHWNERQMRRVALYAEHGELDGRLIQGTIQRIVLANQPETEAEEEEEEDDDVDPMTLQTERRRTCERATYHVSWSNRTQQSLSWRQLRQQLAVRPMNAKHHQLAELLRRLRTADSQQRKDELLRLADPNAMVACWSDPARSDDVLYALQVDFTAPDTKATAIEAAPTETGTERASSSSSFLESARRAFVSRAVSLTRRNLVCVRGRESRALHRQQSTVKTTREFRAIGISPSGDALRALDAIVAFVFAEIADALPGTQQQVAELAADGATLRFTFAANGSTLRGRELARNVGVVSFRCLDTRSPLVVRQDSELRSRLRVLSPPSDSTGAGSDADLPYVFVPLVHEDLCLGVLSVNRFVDVPTGRPDERQPEHGVVEYLSALARPLATALYVKRRSHALFELQQLAHEPLRTPSQLFLAACDALQRVMVGLWKTRVVQIDFARGRSTALVDWSESERQAATTTLATRVVPLGLRADELLPDSIASHWEDADADELLRRWHEYDSAFRRERDEWTREQAEAAASTAKSNVKSSAAAARGAGIPDSERRRREQQRVRDRYERLMPIESLETIADSTGGGGGAVGLQTAARASNPKYLSHTLQRLFSTESVQFASVASLDRSASDGTAVYIATALLPQFLASCEVHFVQRVADSLSRLHEDLASRVERSRARVKALRAFVGDCERMRQTVVERLESSAAVPASSSVKSDVSVTSSLSSFPFSPAEELRVEAMIELQQRAVRVVAETLSCPSVYVGLHQPRLARIVFTAATDRSVMLGKHVHRGRKGLSFQVLDRRKALVLTRTSPVDLVERMVSFAPFKWPVLLTPIGSLGVLSLDNLERYERLADGVPQPELGVVDFVRRVAMALEDVLLDVRGRTAAHRAMRREQALVRVLAVSETSAAPLMAQHVVLRAVEHAFNGVDAYVGLVEPLCRQLSFTSATPRSQMLGQRVNAVDSASFRVFLVQRSLVIPQLERFGLETQTDDDPNAVDASTLQFFGTRAGPRSASGPFVCVPIPFLGVLSVDSFPGAAGGCYASRFPEPGVVETLEAIAAMLGESLRRQLALSTRRDVLPSVFQGNRTTVEHFFRVLLQEIAKNVVSAVELRVLRAKRTPALDQQQPSSSAPPELQSFVSLRSPCAAHFADTSSTLPALMPSIAQALVLSQNITQEEEEDDVNPNVERRVVELRQHPHVLLLRCLATRNVDDDDELALYETVVVVRRVSGATWASDREFLASLAPLTDEILGVINDRVRGIVARRNALAAIDRDALQLELATPSSDALAALPSFLERSLQHIAAAASNPPGDVYLAERQLERDELRYIAASAQSRMLGVTLRLEDPESATLTVVKTLLRWQHDARDDESQRRQRDASDAAGRSLFRPVVTYLPSDPNVPLEPVRVLSSTDRRPQRVFIVVPMLPSGTDSGGAQRRLLCVDSLADNAFDRDNKQRRGQRRRLERDVLSFLERSASRLETAILSVQLRADFDSLCALKTQRHVSLRTLLATLHDVLRRHLGSALHSQQILRLAPDFTGSFDVLSWQHSVAPRPKALLASAATPHLCYRNGCERRWLSPARVHFERHTRLPMTNLPRTLDRSRANAAPAIGRERDGTAFEVDCLATMLDASLPAPPTAALCVFSHAASTTRSSSGRTPSWFSPFHRQFFAAFAAVASDVYASVFRACVFESFAVEWLFYLRERLVGARDALVLTVDVATQLVRVRYAASAKNASPSAKLSTQALQLCADHAAIAMFVSKKPHPAATTASGNFHCAVVHVGEAQGILLDLQATQVPAAQRSIASASEFSADDSVQPTPTHRL